MNVLAKQWRERAEVYRDELLELLKPSSVSTELVAAIKASVMPDLLDAMAAMMELNDARARRESVTTVLRAAAERNNKVRVAAAKGDWDAISRIIDDAANGEPAESITGGVAG